MTQTLTFITNTYKNISIIQPEFWFNSRKGLSWQDILFYTLLSLCLSFVLLSFLIVRSKARENPFKRKFFSTRTWSVLVFLVLGGSLALLHLLGTPLLSARAVWLLYFFGLVYLAYFSFIDYSRKIPEKTARYQSQLLKKKYLRPFKKRR